MLRIQSSGFIYTLGDKIYTQEHNAIHVLELDNSGKYYIYIPLDTGQGSYLRPFVDRETLSLSMQPW